MENETKVCKHCQTEIPKKAKVCPQCRKKQGGVGKWIAIVLVVLFIIGAGSGGSDETEDNKNVSNIGTNNNSTSVEVETEIVYTVYTVDEMMKLLSENALLAEKTYQDQYVEITGRLNVIDSDGHYISLVPVHDEWAILGVQCYIENDEQLDQVLEMKTGDTITLRGQITTIGEVMGYALDIDSID